jgi:hypothetical protein
MSDNLNRDFSQYENMETEELEKILRLDAEAPAGTQTDTELLLYILEVLATRKNTTNTTGNAAQQAWKSFEQNYMPKKPAKPAAVRKSAPWMRRLAAAAAAIALLITIPVAAKALTLREIWGIFVRWTQETFSFVSNNDAFLVGPVKDDSLEYSSIQDILKKNDRDYHIVPTWIPDGFACVNISVLNTPKALSIRAAYERDGEQLIIQIRRVIDGNPYQVEKNEDLIEIYNVDGAHYYIFSNHDFLQTAWVVGDCECFISGKISME